MPSVDRDGYGSSNFAATHAANRRVDRRQTPEVAWYQVCITDGPWVLKDAKTARKYQSTHEAHLVT